MKQLYILIGLLISFTALSQEAIDSTFVFKKRVLESTEIDLLGSYYAQSGIHSAVGGGTGTEELTDVASDIIIAMPLSDDAVLTIDAGFSAYTSASSGNINPFFTDGSYTSNTGASARFAAPGTSGYKTMDDDDDEYESAPAPYGSPWIASSGASQHDVLTMLSATYSHSSNDRNTIWSVQGSGSVEYDYHSLGVGLGLAKLFNEKNSEVSVKATAYFDKWKPIYPTELHEYGLYGLNFLNSGYFNGVTVYDQAGEETRNYLPSAFNEFTNSNRNSYAVSLSGSQIVNKKLQVSVFLDVLYQQGLLSTPYHRVYFADKANYYIGQSRYIPVYNMQDNQGIFRLADDVERLPSTRFKLPVGARVNYYINDWMVARMYYRYYNDNWGLTAHTASIELPVKLGGGFTVYPMYRFYTQQAMKYFAPQDSHYSFEQFYTSDYDLSSFDSHQYGVGASYADIFQDFKIWAFGLKNIDLRYNHYSRSDSLEADIITFGLKFVH
ncbi:hypothetical protein AM493_20100 [Flavobacterium akiainvivens]|uniref:DUF3570 domain-containing protein n=1 Tax=Flavobacterium akiainvivens TaxID=1202724 RepID=A0A0M8MKJ9_9FLAO|nr:DUF3570 domain-containing protein [Flavobacterium akiainvivens]KOS08091.1 hypothetical protein AM493_20100 [Flavobacterium akiainvivens]SFQ71746.1 Protein of unknown function [Flavobacterium akiainvivens]